MTEIIVALDVDTLKEEEALLDLLQGTVVHYKIGMRLFVAHGKRAVDLVHRHGGRVFLDLKFFDIPETVVQAVRQAQKLGVHSVSMHLWGGVEMVRAAAAVTPRPKLWGVTVLTSMAPGDLSLLQPGAALGATIQRLARMAKAEKLDGIICSASDVPELKKALGDGTCFVTPGIRPRGSAADDQRRIVTPADAARLGIRYAVIGRPIIRSEDPLQAVRDILLDMKRAAPAGEEG